MVSVIAALHPTPLLSMDIKMIFDFFYFILVMMSVMDFFFSSVSFFFVVIVFVGSFPRPSPPCAGCKTAVELR